MPDLISTEEAAARLKITPQWLGVLIRTGAIRAYRGSRRRYLLDPKDVTAYRKAHPSDQNPMEVKGAS